MTCVRGADHYDWCAGFSAVLEGGTEKQLGYLWQRLLCSICSKEALAEAAGGPRVDWNPYRPARGEHVLQGVLNSEVYEWRSSVQLNSLCVVGRALLVGASPRSPLNPARHIKPFHIVANNSGTVINGLSSEGTGAQCSGRTGPSCDNDSVTMDAPCTENNKENVPCSTATQDAVDDIFEVLWGTVAVPWIMRRYASEHRTRRGTQETDAQDSSKTIVSSYGTDHGKRFSAKPTRSNDLVPNRRRPKTGPATHRGGAEGRILMALPLEKKTSSRLLHVVGAPNEEFVDMVKAKKNPVVAVKQAVHFPPDLGHSPTQKRVSSFRSTALASFKEAEAERRRSLLLGKPTTRRPSLQCKRKPSSGVLQPRESPSSGLRFGLRGQQNGFGGNILDRKLGIVRASPGSRGRKLAPLPRKANFPSPTNARRKKEEV
ncbi:uncharacterized protein Tco025E_02668 [Trypanosoma conorhini]|uniref:Uncharacterized protein n=1 Tax=Trypanosoma conorhini TaxID=83891 RepID=A0A3S5ITY5_9TRYP|nr:uncharacterized protein Tco025E_02668 [Trypanosoma conorhini]RNF23964.1 hypothetical protein Tco025E_02668 [Trypanosoma conorhini]